MKRNFLNAPMPIAVAAIVAGVCGVVGLVMLATWWLVDGASVFGRGGWQRGAVLDLALLLASGVFYWAATKEAA